MTSARVTARGPDEVAREVERLRRLGHTSFVVVAVDHGGMLDRERVGAARYAAGLQAEVVLEDSPAPVAGVRWR